MPPAHGPRPPEFFTSPPSLSTLITHHASHSGSRQQHLAPIPSATAASSASINALHFTGARSPASNPQHSQRNTTQRKMPRPKKNVEPKAAPVMPAPTHVPMTMIAPPPPIAAVPPPPVAMNMGTGMPQHVVDHDQFMRVRDSVSFIYLSCLAPPLSLCSHVLRLATQQKTRQLLLCWASTYMERHELVSWWPYRRLPSACRLSLIAGILAHSQDFHFILCNHLI
jgi:hypothetical protein